MSNDQITRPGAFLTPEGVHYRVWAPEKQRVEAVLFTDGQPGRTVPLTMQANHYFEGLDPAGAVGDRYKFRLDGDEAGTFPDPASRFQPEGVHGPSMVTAAGAYRWQHDARWRNYALADLVIYELHTGTFTLEGTYLAAIEKLGHIAALGANAIEIMPLADFPGRWNWGYDGVMLYAPARAYGSPDDLRALIDAAHGHGLSVMLDAVYNHLGPDGNYLGAYTKHYFNPAHKTPWGDALNFDGPHHQQVRDFFLGNPLYWMDEFHFDGFRLDAVHAIIDETDRHILMEIAEAIHERGGFVFAEDERNEANLATPQGQGGVGLDGLWADDFHHSVRVAVTGEQESYLQNFTGTSTELADTLTNGWHYRGQPTVIHEEPRGTGCAHLPVHSFCYCISNHDQVGNRAFGERLSVTCSPEAYRAASALLCLAPYTPLIFQGQEWAASTPFLFFTDHNEELGRLITAGRRREFKGFAAFTDEASITRIPDPQAEETFRNSKLNWDEAEAEAGSPHAGVLALYQEALRLRRDDLALRSRARCNWQVMPFGESCVSMIFTAEEAGEIAMVLFSLVGKESAILGLMGSTRSNGEPLPSFRCILSSNETRFGGNGAPEFDSREQTVTFTQPGLVVLKVAVTPTVE